MPYGFSDPGREKFDMIKYKNIAFLRDFSVF